MLNTRVYIVISRLVERVKQIISFIVDIKTIS
jgi:hypothetical protein